MATQKSKTSSPFKWPVRHKLITILIVALLAVGGYFIYDRIALQMNKRAFEQARVAIDTIYADIVTQVGQPDNSKRENSCSRSYFGPYEQRITCSVDTNYIYSVEAEEADRIKSLIKSIVGTHSKVLKQTTYKSSIDINPAPSEGNTNSSIDYYETNRKLLCIFKYVYESTAESDKKLYISSSCSGNAKQQYYPSITSS